MWRVILSVLAVIFDCLMLIFMVFGFIGVAAESGHVPAVRSSAHAATMPNALPAVILLVALTVGLLLNIAAIAFGARLPHKAAVNPADTAGIFG
jgi:hypothetical protein